MPSGPAIDDVVAASIGSVVFSDKSIVLLDVWLEATEPLHDKATQAMEQLISEIEVLCRCGSAACRQPSAVSLCPFS